MIRTFRANAHLAGWTPLLAFIVVFVFTGLIGAVLMLEQYRPFVALYEYFSGTAVPHLTHDQSAITWTLLIVAPALVCLGYALALAVPAPSWLSERALAVVGSARLKTPELLPHVVFYALAFAAVISLRHAGSFANLSSWLHYQSWIESRQRAFAHIGFLGFVNVYIFVPLAAAWVVVTTRPAGPIGHVLRWTPLVLSVGLEALLFQRKAAMVAAIIVLASAIYYTAPTSKLRVFVVLGATIAGVLAIYFTAVVLPVYSRSQEVVAHRSQSGQSSSPPTGGPPGLHRLTPREAELVAERRTGIFLYSTLSPLVRTSAAALYYPVVYPHKHRFYGLDVGQDILGIGTMPDDNIVTWRYMNPGGPAGTTAAPFQFVLYSQVGVAGALGLSVVFGLLLGLLWRGATARAVPRSWASMLGAMVILLGVYFAIDSPRNSTLVSYGVVWGFLFIAAAAVVVHLVNGVTVERRRQAAPKTLGPS